MTKQFYIHDEISQLGPFSFDELKARDITQKTAIWFKGLLKWTSAGEIDELKTLFEEKTLDKHEVPPFYQERYSNDDERSPKRKRMPGLKLSLLMIAFLASAFSFVFINDPNAMHAVSFKTHVPKPKIISSSVDGTSSGIFNAQTTVDATVFNEGDDGMVSVTFYVHEGDNIFDKRKTMFIPAGEKLEFESIFENVNYVDGKIAYNVEAKAE